MYSIGDLHVNKDNIYILLPVKRCIKRISSYVPFGYSPHGKMKHWTMASPIKINQVTTFSLGFHDF